MSDSTGTTVEAGAGARQTPAEPMGPVAYLAIALAWAVPGLGHLMIGKLARGVIFAVCIHGLFAGGLLLGGMRAIGPVEQPIWTYTQYLTGWPMLVCSRIAAVKERERAAFEENYRSDRPEEWTTAPADMEKVRQERIAFGKGMQEKYPYMAYSPKVQDIGSVYCGIAGMLNLLVMFDVLLRVTATPRAAGKDDAKGAA